MDEPELCRLCGVKITLSADRNFVRKESYSRDIKVALDIDIECDGTFYPRYICECCRRKLQRWRKVYNKDRKRAVLNIKLHQWTSTSNDDFIAITNKETMNTPMVPVVIDDTQSNYIIFDPKSMMHIVDLHMHKNGTWSVFSFGREVTNSTLFDFPKPLTSDKVGELISVLINSQVCSGNTEFPQLVESRQEFKNRHGTVIANVENSATGTCIRHVKCEMLISQNMGNMCPVCKVYKTTLSLINKKQSNQTERCAVSSHVPNVNLSEKEKLQKLSSLQIDRHNLQQQTERLKRHIANLIDNEGVELSQEESTSLKTALDNGRDELDKLLPKNSPQHILWQQQLERLAGPSKQMRWHPAIIRWCIALNAKSSGAYKYLRSSGFINLPCQQTLRDFTQFTEATSGFQPDIMGHIVQDCNLNLLHDWQKNVSLLFDEMKIKSGLVYSKREGRLVGFTHLGDINSEVSKFNKNCTNSQQPPELATHILCLMVRGLFVHSIKHVIAHFPCTGFKADQLYPCIWEGVEYLELVGFKVRAFVCDGASPNRKFYKFHYDGHPQSMFSTSNPFDETRPIYFICDVPHLMKTTRNNWENSGWNKKSRNLFYKKQAIKWTHLVDLVENDAGAGMEAPGFHLLPKLRMDHIHLKPAMRMKVNLAVQVLSASVASALEVQGRHDTSSTQKFVRMFDTFFDCLNVTNRFDGVRKQKKALLPYTETADWRFTWLEQDFLGFLDEWKAECLNMPNMTKADKLKMFISEQTHIGLKITVHSFINLAKELLEIPSVTYFLSEKLTQDPLEEHFSKQRGCGGQNTNPTALQFAHNELTLMVAGSRAVASVHGNCRKRQPEAVDMNKLNQPLLRRKKSKNVPDDLNL